jgi:hypothetical protein
MSGVFVLFSIFNYGSDRFRRKNIDNTIKFEINIDDKSLIDLIEDFGTGYYGTGEFGLSWLFYELNKEGYEVNCKSEYIYTINRIAKRVKPDIKKRDNIEH